MRKLTKERQRIRKFLEEENWSDVDVQWLEDALHDLDEANRKLKERDTELDQLDAEVIMLRAQLADTQKDLGTTVRILTDALTITKGKLTEAEVEAEKLREVERAARILMDVTRDGDEELVKADMRALNTTLAAVDALRREK